MKKSIFTFIAATTISVTAFAQIPNSGFENWTAVSTYSVPNGWGTLNGSD